MLKFRPNTIDRAIFHHVTAGNEYRLPDRFREDDVILDIGAHIGSFALAALERGAGFVRCVEADGCNAALCRHNLADHLACGRVEVTHGAAWRSDGVCEGLFHSGYTYHRCGLLNTGAGIVGTVGGRRPTPNLPFDDVVRSTTAGRGDRIRLLKLDCEGSEYPILLTSATLHQIDEIVGEFHEFGGDFDRRPLPFELGGRDHLTVLDLDACLTAAGFEFSHRRHRVEDEAGRTVPEHLGYFSARR